MKQKTAMCASAMVVLVLVGIGLAAEGTGELTLGPWYCVGPFKDKADGLHLTSFATVFGPEADALAAGGRANLAATWQARTFPGMTDTARGWVKHPEWVDGFRNQLPVGPAPMRNETCYLYRTVTAAKAASVEMHIFARDNIRVWLGGKVLAQANNPGRSGASRFDASVIATMNLAAGVNHLLVKITSMHGRHGFAFAIPQVTPFSPHRPGAGPRVAGRFRPGDEPYASGDKALPVRTPPHADALRRLRELAFDVRPIPMYDPPRLKIADVMERQTPPTPAGAAYLSRLAALRRTVSAALAPSAAEAPVIGAAGRVEAFWRKEIAALPPIAFIRCPPFAVNAIAPYIARGATPASICVFDPARPNRAPRVIFAEDGTAIFDMNVSYDAKTILFSARRRGVGGGWHVYEIGVDGTGLKQITKGWCDDISPLLLPSGEVMFVSTRAGTRVVCQKQPAGVLYVCNRDGSNVRRVSGNSLSDHTPQIMNDGRVLFTRWDYGVDKNVFCRQNLWTMNPDGTAFQLFGPNTKEDPNGFWQARAIPGRGEVVCVFGPHHQYHAGMIGLVWDRPGFEPIRGESFRWVTRELPTVGDMTLSWGYQDPWPINEHQYIVSYGGDGGRKNRQYLLDSRGNRKCIYEAEGTLGCWSPVVLAPRRRPPVVSSDNANTAFAFRDPVEAHHAPDTRMGTFLVQDVHIGMGTNVKRGEVKQLAILEQVPKFGDPRGAQIWGYSPTIGRGTMYVRRIIGTVPVEADGSAHFQAPAIRDISFNALDAEGRTIRRMGSTLHIMPGEKRSCIGCHESRSAPPPAKASSVAAARRAPSVPKYPSWTDKGLIDFTKVVQPVLDKHCVKCHSGATPKAALDLSGDKTHSHSMAYDSLIDRGQVHYIPLAGTGHEEGTAKGRGAMVSAIRKRIETKHSGKVVALEDRKRIYMWIDANVPYYGTYEFTNTNVMGGRDRWYVTDKGKWFRRDFLPVFNKRCIACHARQVTPQTYNYNPRGRGTITVTSKIWNDAALGSFQLGHGRISMIGQIGPVHRINLTHPEWSQMLTAPLSKKAGGLQLCKAANGGPVFKDTTDADYQLMLKALQLGRDTLLADPRVDMPEELARKPKPVPVLPLARTTNTTWPTRKTGWVSKTATYEASSIIPKWSKDKDKLLTGQPYANHWAVCTEKEDSPWIIITLPSETAISEVEIVNRLESCQEFARTLTMSLSTDKKTWTEVWRAKRVCEQWNVKLANKPRARYVKLALREKQYLDLKYVFVFSDDDADAKSKTK